MNRAQDLYLNAQQGIVGKSGDVVGLTRNMAEGRYGSLYKAFRFADLDNSGACCNSHDVTVDLDNAGAYCNGYGVTVDLDNAGARCNGRDVTVAQCALAVVM